MIAGTTILIRRFAAVALGAAVLWPLAGAAQYSGCILDNCADKKPLPSPAAGNNPGPVNRGSSGDWSPGAGGSIPSGDVGSPGDFDFYVFSLSWSPGFCDLGGAEKAPDQCHSGANLGFVVHGLWPQDAQGYPSDCGGVTSPSWLVLESTRGLYPDIGLARYEWRKHGTCSGKSPAAYFADVRRAHDLVAIPPMFQNAQSEQDTTALDIERAFIAANPRLRPGMMAVECVNGELSEVRICLSKDVRTFVPCPDVARHTCHMQDIAVAPMR